MLTAIPHVNPLLELTVFLLDLYYDDTYRRADCQAYLKGC